MGWNEVDDKLETGLTDRNKVSCDEEYELNYIHDVIKEEFPHSSDDDINNAIRNCCETVPAPRLRRDFVECLKRRLGRA